MRNMCDLLHTALWSQPVHSLCVTAVASIFRLEVMTVCQLCAVCLHVYSRFSWHWITTCTCILWCRHLHRHLLVVGFDEHLWFVHWYIQLAAHGCFIPRFLAECHRTAWLDLGIIFIHLFSLLQLSQAAHILDWLFCFAWWASSSIYIFSSFTTVMQLILYNCAPHVVWSTSIKVCVLQCNDIDRWKTEQFISKWQVLHFYCYLLEFLRSI